MLQNNEHILLQRLKSGSEEAYEAIYQLYHKRLFSFSLKYLKSRELSEDAVHDTFIKLWENRLSIHSSLKAFLFTSARNHVLNMVRNRKRKIIKQIQLEKRTPEATNRTEEVILYSEYQHIYRRGLEQLPEGKREIFRLKTEQQLTNREIATMLDITIHTVKSQYYEATKFIKEYLDVHAGIHPGKARSQ